MKPLQVIVGLLAGHFIGKAMWAALFWMPGMVVAAKNLSGGGSLHLGWFSLAYIAAVAISIVVWMIGNLCVYALLPRAGVTSAILSAVVGIYVAVLSLPCLLFDWDGGLCQTIIWTGWWF
ncbi:MAG: hypothetical protein AAF630_14005 [Cyanobacteria bacterium P01_C01_bin.38]